MNAITPQHKFFVPKVKSKYFTLFNEINNKNEVKLLQDLLLKYFKSERWWSINKGEAIFDQQTGLLWQGKIKAKKYRYDQQEAAQLNINNLLGLSHWRIPPASYLENLVKTTPKFPLRTGSYYEINHLSIWLVSDRRTMILNQSRIQYEQSYNTNASVLAVNELLMAFDPIEMIDTFLEKGWSFLPYDIASNDVNGKAFLTILIKYQQITQAKNEDHNLLRSWQNLDYLSVRLPKIDIPTFTDPNKGLWEFYVPPSQLDKFTEAETNLLIRARNPALDIQHAPVAIDFGTSSTVVAIRQNGRDELLRIGIQDKDFDKTITAEQFENPTILELRNITEFLTAWHSEAYRPLVNWDHVHCSHEAKASFNNQNAANSTVIPSIFARLKQWALRDVHHQVIITDQQGTEEVIQPLAELNPVKGQAIQMDQNYPKFDPIELYAWFLGMNINWRGRGIFLDYYMTFPVAYPIEVKDKILTSFRRGLQRSLPESLLADEQFNQFNVREWASEPAAYAAAALEKLAIEPTEEGIAYAVFDFGGGTTDFDYGIYREPTEQEEDTYDHVIEHFGAAGDPFLGGENLLENMAYMVFKDNLDICRKQKISFTMPLDAEKFIGSEQLIDDSQAAYMNSTLLISFLRPFWEAGKFKDDISGSLTIDLLNRENKVVPCPFAFKQNELLAYLQSRIFQGLLNFFLELKQAFTHKKSGLPKEIHLLLAGNSSRSPLVKNLLSSIDSNIKDTENPPATSLLNLAHIFGENVPHFHVHYPLDADLKHHDVMTAKTGVALGLLRLCPGEGLKVINHAKNENIENSPFQFYVGRQKRGKFEVVIHRGDAYHEWQALGAVSEEGIFLLLSSSQAKALAVDGMKRGETGLFEHRLSFSGNLAGQKVFARIIAPNQIDICSAMNVDEVNAMGGNNLQQIMLS